jgi:hypothetical protein
MKASESSSLMGARVALVAAALPLVGLADVAPIDFAGCLLRGLERTGTSALDFVSVAADDLEVVFFLVDAK